MSETSLYRKYRPHKFKDVIGQDHIVTLLEQSIKNNTIAHAYIFAGSRGTGKTSVARIFARELGVGDTDLYEIDAASNTGVDDVRLLTDSVYVLPFESKYKIYLLDEAHMLSKSAFNALLKTIEEPPAHVIFILATTETEKLPDTIISRCQLLQFNKPTRADLMKSVTKVAGLEDIKLEKGVSEIIARMGDGSYRDTLGALQKIASAYPKGAITLLQAEEVIGAPRSSVINELLHALDHKDPERGLKAIQEAQAAQVSIKLVLELLLDKVRAVLLVRTAPKLVEDMLADLGDEDAEIIRLIAVKKDSAINSKILLELLKSEHAMRFTSDQAIPLELVFLSLAESAASLK